MVIVFLQYALDRLKAMCQNTLISSLTVNNVSEILHIADLHGANELKSSAINFLNMYEHYYLLLALLKKMMMTG